MSEYFEKIKSEELAEQFVKNESLLVLRTPLCPLCGKKLLLQRINGKKNIFRCSKRIQLNGIRKRACRFKISSNKYSFFSNMNLTYSETLKILYYYSFKMTYEDIAFECSVNVNSVALVINKLLYKVEFYFSFVEIIKIGGPGMTIEIDETHIMTRKHDTGRVLSKQKIWIVGGKCRTTKKCFFEVVTQRNAQVLSDIILKYVNNGTTIVTDMWKGYANIQRMGFIHLKVNHSINFVDIQNRNIHTQGIEREWRSLKEFLPKPIKNSRVGKYLLLYVYFKNKKVKLTSEKFKSILSLIKE